jgi:hypothetical protein
MLCFIVGNDLTIVTFRAISKHLPKTKCLKNLYLYCKQHFIGEGVSILMTTIFHLATNPSEECLLELANALRQNDSLISLSLNNNLISVAALRKLINAINAK